VSLRRILRTRRRPGSRRSLSTGGGGSAYSRDVSGGGFKCQDFIFNGGFIFNGALKSLLDLQTDIGHT